MNKKYSWLLGFVLGGIVSVFAGLSYFHHELKAKIFRPNPKISFSLIDADGSLYEFSRDTVHTKTYIVYLPDNITRETQENYMRVIKRAPQLAAQKKNLLVVSRMDMDNLRNVKRLSGFSGHLLADPSGSVLKKIQDWKPDSKHMNWVTAELAESGEITRAKSADAPELSWLE